MTEQLITHAGLDLALLASLTQKPTLFAPGEPRFWNDPYIATQMLATHLDPNTDLASRRPETIDRIVTWLYDALQLKPDTALLDLGCGPGLYARRFVERGVQVTGVDFSENSLAYARQHDPTSTYLTCDYRALDTYGWQGVFEAAVLIFGDLCVLNDGDRDAVLGHIYHALKPGGRFAFDVSTPAMHPFTDGETSWVVVEGPGFWKPGPHLVLEGRFVYPEHDTCLEQFAVIETEGTTSIYRNWFHDYTPDTISPVLEAAGFNVRGIYGDLCGTPYTPGSQWAGVVVEKPL
ncbi:MAG: class I SAM-dependent methyltransferase [Anaerolineae bacterium]|nr:class I SAM-dependent methyltransferase [Anaerolineae bacterium]